MQLFTEVRLVTTTQNNKAIPIISPWKNLVVTIVWGYKNEIEKSFRIITFNLIISSKFSNNCILYILNWIKAMLMCLFLCFDHSIVFLLMLSLSIFESLCLFIFCQRLCNLVVLLDVLQEENLGLNPLFPMCDK